MQQRVNILYIIIVLLTTLKCPFHHNTLKQEVFFTLLQ